MEPEAHPTPQQQMGPSTDEQAVTAGISSLHLEQAPTSTAGSSTKAQMSAAAPPTERQSVPAAATTASASKASFTAALTAAQHAAANHQFRSAATTCASLLLLRPGHKATSLTLAEVLTAAGQPAAAVEVLQAAVKASASSTSASSSISSAGPDVQLLRQLGVCQVAAGQLEAALDTFQEALAFLDEQDPQQGDLQACCASALYPRGGVYAEAATQVLLNVLQRNEAVPAALRQYAVVAADQGLWDDVAKVTVRLLVKAPEDRQVQQLLAQAAQHAEGMQQLLLDVGTTPDSAAALAFLAHTMKDHGAVQQAVQLYRKAVQLQPASSSYALSLAHTLELDHDYAVVLQVVLGFCEVNRRAVLGPLQLQAVLQLPLLSQLSCQPFQPSSTTWLLSSPWCPGPSLEDRQAAAAAAGGPSAASSCMDVPEVVASWCSSNSSSNSTATAGSSRKAGQQQPELPAEAAGHAPDPAGRNGPDRPSMQPDWCAVSGLQPDSPDRASSSSRISGCCLYQPHELDILALLFTAAKVLYVGGAFTAAAQLLQLCDAARRASQEALHCTLIRNEAAYAGCVMQLLWDCPPPPPALQLAVSAACSTEKQASSAADAAGAGASAAANDRSSKADSGAGHCSSSSSSTAPASAGMPLYFCGDSHCLSGAWRSIAVAGQVRLLHPLLVTGLKVWHLRPGSSYYPRYQFWQAVGSLPPGSQVVLLLGEIDCREGLLAAVERMKYESLAQAAAATVDIYMAVLLQLVKERQLQVFVHPVPPVLDETRHIVKLFESALKQAVQAAVQSNPEIKGQLLYLDFFDWLLTSDRLALQPQLQFDGTHLHPRYLQQLERAVNAAVAPTT